MTSLAGDALNTARISLFGPFRIGDLAHDRV